MKKSLQKLVLVCLFLGAFTYAQAQRYTTEIFPSATVTSNVPYGSNISVLTGTPTSQPLVMDVYQPAGAVDPLAKRPLVIMLHTGSFLPKIINQTPTGGKTDSTLVEMCTQFAKRGYVAISADYRTGWNPAATGSTGQDIRTGTLLQAVYRAIQDAKACVRYIKANVATGGNTYGIDTNYIVLGGMGSGGYVALAYATLNSPAEISLPKFTAGPTNATYGFVAGQPYVNQSLLGDFEGYGGIPQLNNPNNSVGYSSHINFVFNCGGALGDSSWLQQGDVPMVCYHVVSDPFAPYGDGPVIVPTTGDFVVDVSGSQTVITRANSFNNNACFANAGFTDPLTVYANSVNGGQEGLYPLYMPGPQAGPWEWFDSTVTVQTAIAYGYSAGQGDTIYHSALLTNPNMSAAKGRAYIDTIMGYLNPRVKYCLALPTAVKETTVENTIKVVPNPATDRMEIVIGNPANPIRSVRMYDLIGKEIINVSGLNESRYTINRNGMTSGMYIVRIGFENGELSQKVLFH